MIAAVIGTREPNSRMARLCEAVCRKLRDAGYYLATGNALGIDNIARDTWNERFPERVILYLPWAGYNAGGIHPRNRVIVFSGQRDWLESVRKYHPAPDRLSSAAVKLHARNFGIVKSADLVIAFPRSISKPGGTGQGMRIAEALGKRLYVLPKDLGFDYWQSVEETG
ncbi:hypothetical protein [Desulfofundulus australicus]|uniref:hypothetical protein n=1 Tax=Desulfofundulus australicus TaxID=1566 RepID=UPI0009340E13|nr:hypothetical protein [Desulfofundulus australicus]